MVQKVAILVEHVTLCLSLKLKMLQNVKKNALFTNLLENSASILNFIVARYCFSIIMNYFSNSGIIFNLYICGLVICLQNKVGLLFI